MNSHEHLVGDFINDSTCVTLMIRDGVKAHDIMNLMRSVRPMVLTESSYRRQREGLARFAA